MVPATAAGFVLAGFALVGLTTHRPRMVRALSGAVLFVALLRIAAYTFDWDLPIDHLGLGSGGRMSGATAAGFTVLGLGLFLATRAVRADKAIARLVQAAALGIILLAWLGLSAYVYRGQPFTFLSGLSLPTAALFLITGLALLMVRSDAGLPRLLASDTPRGATARRLLPAAVLAPLAIGWVPLYAARHEWLGIEAAFSLFALCAVAAFIALVWSAITTSERTEQTGNERLQLIIDNALDAVISMDSAGRITEWRGQAHAIFGWSRGEVLGRMLADVIIPPDYRQAHQRGLERYLSSGASRVVNRRLELTGLHRSGAQIPVELAITAVPDGDAALFTAFIRDIAERKAAELELRASEARFRTLAQSLPQLVWTCRPDGWCDYLSPQWVQYTGIPEAAQMGYAWAEQLHPQDRQRVSDEWTAATARGGVFDVEFRIRRHDGVYRWFKTRAVPLRDAAGQIVKWFGSNTDIENDKQSEARLRSQLERMDLLDRTTRAIAEQQDSISILRAVVKNVEESLPADLVCIALRTEEGAVTLRCIGMRTSEQVRSAFFEEQSVLPIEEDGLAHCLRGQVVYDPDLSKLDFEMPKRLAAAGLGCLVLAPLTVGGTVVGALLVARCEAESFSSTDCEFLRQLGEHLALALQQAQLRDALQAAYIELQRSQEETLRQERLRALGEMASGIAHDINNALSPAALYVQSLREQETQLSSEARSWLQTIERAIHHVAQTVARLRDFSRQREPQLQHDAVDLNALIGHLLELMRARWEGVARERGILIEPAVRLAPELPPIRGSAAEIRDALTNLMFNAIDAMPEGGTLTVSTTSRYAGVAQRVPQVEVEIADTGVGMDEATRARCLEPYFTTKGERGTGLGLAMVYATAERHGAQLQIDSETGRGTRVRLVFPAAGKERRADTDTDTDTDADGTPAAIVKAALQTPVPGRRLLVVDDDPLVLQTLCETLEMQGHSVTAAEGGQAGIDIFRDTLNGVRRFDLVITDLGMPQVDGRQVARAVKAVSPGTPVVLLSGWGQQMSLAGTMPPAVDVMLSKPPRLAELNDAIAKLVALGP